MSVQKVRSIEVKTNLNIFRTRSSPLRCGEINSKSEDSILSCKCPKILCCDDDEFQHLTVKKLLDTLDVSTTSSNLSFYYSGEDLIQHFTKFMTCCQCGGPELIISDYNMGQDKMDGVQVIKKLRDLGFKGQTILRTSNSIQTMTDIHTDFDFCLRRELINYHLGKANLKVQKEIFKQFLIKTI